MDARTQARFQARARILKALAHPSRLFMVEQLSRRQHCVCELAEMVGADISTVSKHLSVLKAAGIVDDARRGMQVYYRLRFPCVLRFFDCVGEVMKLAAREQMNLVSIR
jgi:ArsR family transcriptional regulator